MVVHQFHWTPTAKVPLATWQPLSRDKNSQSARQLRLPKRRQGSVNYFWDGSLGHFRRRRHAWPHWRPGRMPASRWKRKCFRRPWRMPRCADADAGFLLADLFHQGSVFFLEKQIECLVYKFMSSFRDDLGPQST